MTQAESGCLRDVCSLLGHAATAEQRHAVDDQVVSQEFRECATRIRAVHAAITVHDQCAVAVVDPKGIDPEGVDPPVVDPQVVEVRATVRTSTHAGVVTPGTVRTRYCLGVSRSRYRKVVACAMRHAEAACRLRPLASRRSHRLETQSEFVSRVSSADWPHVRSARPSWAFSWWHRRRCPRPQWHLPAYAGARRCP